MLIFIEKVFPFIVLEILNIDCQELFPADSKACNFQKIFEVIKNFKNSDMVSLILVWSVFLFQIPLDGCNFMHVLKRMKDGVKQNPPEIDKYGQK